MPDIHCVVESAEGGLAFRWWHGQDAFEPYAFKAGGGHLRDLDKAADRCRRVYADHVLPAVLAGGGTPPRPGPRTACWPRRGTRTAGRRAS